MKVNLPDWLDEDKLKEVITKLHHNTLLYIAKLKESYGDKFNNDEKLQIYAEYLGFDLIFKEYKIEKEVIESALITFNLNINYT